SGFVSPTDLFSSSRLASSLAPASSASHVFQFASNARFSGCFDPTVPRSLFCSDHPAPLTPCEDISSLSKTMVTLSFSEATGAAAAPACKRLDSVTRSAPCAIDPAAPLPADLEVGPFLTLLSSAWRSLHDVLPACSEATERMLARTGERDNVQVTLLRGFLQSLKGASLKGAAEDGGQGDPSAVLDFFDEFAFGAPGGSVAIAVVGDPMVVLALLRLVTSQRWAWKCNEKAVDIVALQSVEDSVDMYLQDNHIFE
ncbi:hypothetical protein TeGR_g122, partial [Tetraparma gracilis]